MSIVLLAKHFQIFSHNSSWLSFKTRKYHIKSLLYITSYILLNLHEYKIICDVMDIWSLHQKRLDLFYFKLEIDNFCSRKKCTFFAWNSNIIHIIYKCVTITIIKIILVKDFTIYFKTIKNIQFRNLPNHVKIYQTYKEKKNISSVASNEVATYFCSKFWS